MQEKMFIEYPKYIKRWSMLVLTEALHPRDEWSVRSRRIKKYWSVEWLAVRYLDHAIDLWFCPCCWKAWYKWELMHQVDNYYKWQLDIDEIRSQLSERNYHARKSLSSKR